MGWKVKEVMCGESDSFEDVLLLVRPRIKLANRTNFTPRPMRHLRTEVYANKKYASNDCRRGTLHALCSG